MHTYQAVDAALIRTTTFPTGLELPPWPDLNSDDVATWQLWLRQAWALDGFAVAVRGASRELAAQVERQLASPAAADRSSVRSVRRLVETLMRYLLRWTSRATPFGLFAGIAPVEFDARARAAWEGDHRVVHRPDGLLVAEQAGRIEARLDMLRTVPVVTNSLGFARGRVWVVPGVSADGQLWDAEVNLTRPVRLAVDLARRPIGFADLAAKLAVDAPTVERAVIERMLAGLVAHRVLVTPVRPPMTVTDPATHLARYTPGPEPEPAVRPAADVRVGCAVALPAAVLREAERAASVLTLVAPEMPGWRPYHQEFLDRYGPGAAVPVRELVGGSGLGLPPGYRASHRRAPRLLTARDVTLAKIAQHAALDGRAEVLLGDELIAALTVADRPPVPHTELRFSLAAESLGDLDRGAFTLTVISGARHAGVTVGRFLHLLDPAEQERFRHAYATLPTATPGAIRAQISGPPLAEKMTAVARVPEILPVLPLGEYQDNHGLDIDDLAVTGDARRLWLVSLSRARPVEPMLFNAVDLAGGQQPLARFLTEIWTAFAAPCCSFTWGPVARELPFLPRVRHGRSILRPARWTISATDLPGRAEALRDWRKAWERLRETYRIPAGVLLGDDDVRIRLDLEEPAHLALLRGQLDRQPAVVLTEAGGQPGWFEGRPHELVVTLGRTTDPPPPRHPRPVQPATTVEHRPGLAPWLYVKVYGRADEILARFGDLLGDDALGRDRWWFVRYHEPEPHLRLRIPLQGADHFPQPRRCAHRQQEPLPGRAADASSFGAGPALAAPGAVITFEYTVRQLARWADALRAEALLRDYTIHTYRPETRFGAGPTLSAAEAVFAADSHTVVQRLTGNRTVATAAGLIGIADGFTGNGPGWLIDHVEHRGGPPSAHPGRRVSADREQVATLVGQFENNKLRQALVDYRARVEHDGLDPDRVLADLLHIHHARMIGIDRASERHCLLLARATARTLLLQGTT
ncbi:lantibiotic dehydratase [Frankia sp. CNm7]|uniref:Lantibiotic dehydratase n=1 Tax=Frankia nepalensis TaxID=1836974 RepID=A0A937R8G3_9ACTN|nr:lantibiotic dehydratase [Frankia nepalensis]MBL7496332.1 lantibiotic dehydratase [Frankia nepalensis]MBL7508471.1 lantibiotic dehydratase [Frankia nepalensis]MBL7521635.1 lantibiotic dehydratase [Frankia nepalensis]MBL7627603.1 lantibiotic dehydratase [Frankia nepalensis]